jgi:hypothetical protein
MVLGFIATFWSHAVGVAVVIAGGIVMSWAQLEVMGAAMSMRRSKKGSRGGRH